MLIKIVCTVLGLAVFASLAPSVHAFTAELRRGLAPPRCATPKVEFTPVELPFARDPSDFYFLLDRAEHDGPTFWA